MNYKESASAPSYSNDDKRFDYDNSGWPRDFDIRIEVAEQREVLLPESKPLHGSEYDS